MAERAQHAATSENTCKLEIFICKHYITLQTVHCLSPLTTDTDNYVNIQEYTILVILNDAGYVRMINLFRHAHLVQGGQDHGQIRMFPIKDVCVCVFLFCMHKYMFIRSVCGLSVLTVIPFRFTMQACKLQTDSQGVEQTVRQLTQTTTT